MLPADVEGLRSDARRNRDAIVLAARDLFAEQRGTDAQMDQIAQRAGVGVETLYRHFRRRRIYSTH